MFDREDVLNFSLKTDPVIAYALSPSAAVAAKEAGIDTHSTTSLFSNMGHARCVAMASKALRELEHAVHTQFSLPPSVLLMARQTIWSHANLVHRLQYSLPRGPWLARDRHGKWIKADDWQTLQAVLLPRIWNYGLAHRITAGRPFFPGLFKTISRLSLLLDRTHQLPAIASLSRKLKNGLQLALSERGTKVEVLQPTQGRWTDYIALARELATTGAAHNHRVTPLSNKDPRVLSVLASLERIGNVFSDARTQSAWSLYQPYFRSIIPAMLGMVSDGPLLLRRLKTRAVITYEANSWIAAALMEAAGKAGIKRFVFNHNSHPPSGSSIADSVLNTLFHHRTFNELTDVAALWSPFSAHWLSASNKNNALLEQIPVRLDYAIDSPPTTKNRPFRILHAGNYQNWSDFFPWIAETSDEYINGIETLADTVEQMDNVELIIRVRPKRELDSAAVAGRLGERRNVAVCGTTQEFLSQLAECDLLVSHFSTTVEQALQMGKPVLLWGSTDRYCQFPAQLTPPLIDSAQGVFAVQNKADLLPMLIGIRDTHQNDSCAEKRVEKYGFCSETPGIDQLAARLAGASARNIQ